MRRQDGGRGSRGVFAGTFSGHVKELLRIVCTPEEIAARLTATEVHRESVSHLSSVSLPTPATLETLSGYQEYLCRCLHPDGPGLQPGAPGGC